MAGTAMIARTGTARAFDRPFASFAEFYQTVYAPYLVEQRTAGRLGVNMVMFQQPKGEFPDAPHPELCLQFLASDPVPAEIDIGAGRFSTIMPTGSFVLAPPNTATDYVIGGAHRVMGVAMPYRKLTAMAAGVPLPPDGDFGRLHAGPTVDPLLAQIATRMWEEAADGNPHGGLFADGAALTILSGLLRLAGLPSANARGGLPGWRLRRVLEYIEAHLREDIGLADLAAAVDLSPYHFSRAFKETTGLSPHAYVIRRRVERSKELLAGTGLALAEVALACGFASQSHFSTAFRKLTGMSPGRYRAALRA